MKNLPRESYIGLGLIFGVAVGVAQNNVGLWIAVGLAIGVGVYTTAKKKDETDED